MAIAAIKGTLKPDAGEAGRTAVIGVIARSIGEAGRAIRLLPFDARLLRRERASEVREAEEKDEDAAVLEHG